MKRMTLVEKATWDHLREKKAAEKMTHPELMNMIEIQQQIEGILMSTKLSDDEKVDLLDRARTRFEKIRDTLNPADDMPAAAAVPIAAPAAAPPAVAPPAAAPPLVAAPAVVAAGIPPPPPGGPPPPPRRAHAAVAVGPSQAPILTGIRLPQQYHAKFDRLKDFLNAHPKIASKNALNEMILDGNRIPNSNFDDLIRNLYVPKDTYNLTGMSDFISTLKREKLPKDDISSKAAINHLNASFTSQGTMKAESTPVKDSKHKGKDSKQSGKGVPPGKRPRVLFLYH